jgi:hypothetical protein
MKNTTVLTVVMIVCVALAAIVLVPSAVNAFQASCESGDADPGLCKVAEIGGLFDEDQATPAPAAEAEVGQ